MKKLDYLVAACNAGAWKRLVWRVSIFNVCMFPEASETPENYDLNYIDNYPHYWFDGGWVKFEDGVENEELFLPEVRFTLKEGDYPAQKEPLETTVGRYVLNWVVIHYAFGERMPYLAKGRPMDIRKELYSRCLSHEDDEPENDMAIRPSMVDRFVGGMAELAPITKGIAPTGTIRSWTVHPDTYKIRDALLLKYKDELDNPAVVVKIEKALDELDTEWLSGDQSIQFYNSKKSRMRRRKLMLMYGIEGAFHEAGDYTLIPNALVEDEKEGLNNLVAKYNAIRDGSYSRGAETAKGGEQVRIIQMIYQNHRIVDDDCGTKLRHLVTLTVANKHRYIGMTADVGGKFITVDETFAASNMGKVIKLRRPILCQYGHVDCCSGCASKTKAEEPRAIAADISSGFSNVMGVAMAKMHGTQTVVRFFNPTDYFN